MSSYITYLYGVVIYTVFKVDKFVLFNFFLIGKPKRKLTSFKNLEKSRTNNPKDRSARVSIPTRFFHYCFPFHTTFVLNRTFCKVLCQTVVCPPIKEFLLFPFIPQILIYGGSSWTTILFWIKRPISYSPYSVFHLYTRKNIPVTYQYNILNRRKYLLTSMEKFYLCIGLLT